MTKRVAGMDLAASGVKLAFFTGNGPKAKFERFAVTDTADEAILSERELQAALKELLESVHGESCELTVSLPQYQVTTTVSDYPTTSPKELKRLVALETTQLGGFTDDAFVHGFMPMPGGAGRVHPVLIALSREDSIRERYRQLTSDGLRCRRLVPTGLALAAAVSVLRPDAFLSDAPVITLDIGRENTVMTVTACGQVLYLGTLMFGAVKFEDAARQYQQSHRSVEGQSGRMAYLSQADVSNETRQSPLLQAVQTLEAELQNAVEHWRSQELQELAEKPVPLVLVTGGGSRLGGLCGWLSQVLECKVEPIAPEENGEARPELTVAYGLGLQACGLTACSLSLIPEDLELARLRRIRWPFLAAAAFLGVGCVIGSLLTAMAENADANEALGLRKKQLEALVEDGAVINRLRRTAGEQEALLAEIAACGNGSARLVRAVEQISRTPLPDGWIVCLADEATARAAGDFFETDAGKTSQSGLPVQAYVCAGFLPRATASAGIEGIQKALSSGGLFREVDRSDSLEEGGLSSLVWDWRKALNLSPPLKKAFPGNPAAQFEFFTLTMPFVRPDVRATEEANQK